jgi:hypothetical protein
VNLKRYREYLSAQSTAYVRDEVVRLRKSAGDATALRTREAWEKLLETAQDVLKVMEAKDEARSRM